MKTQVPKKTEIERKWFIVDAKGKTLGKIAVKIADQLRGKNKAYFTPHMDCGDFVIVINSKEIRLSGNKKEDKMYYRHSGYPGGFKEENAAKIFRENPNKIIEQAVKGMLPKNKLRDIFMGKLKVYSDEKHPHEAQAALPLEI